MDYTTMTTSSYYRDIPENFLMKLVEQLEQSERILTDLFDIWRCRKQKDVIMQELNRRQSNSSENDLTAMQTKFASCKMGS